MTTTVEACGVWGAEGGRGEGDVVGELDVVEGGQVPHRGRLPRRRRHPHCNSVLQT